MLTRKHALTLLLSLLSAAHLAGCQPTQLATGSTPNQATAWVGYPKDAPDWPYRYVFDSPRMESGWIERQREGTWQYLGPVEGLEHTESTVTFDGPIGDTGKLVYIDYSLESTGSATDGHTMRMTCMVFDSRSVELAFKTEPLGNTRHEDADRPRSRSSTTDYP